MYKFKNWNLPFNWQAEVWAQTNTFDIGFQIEKDFSWRTGLSIDLVFLGGSLIHTAPLKNTETVEEERDESILTINGIIQKDNEEDFTDEEVNKFLLDKFLVLLEANGYQFGGSVYTGYKWQLENPGIYPVLTKDGFQKTEVEKVAE